jgi:protein TonB
MKLPFASVLALTALLIASIPICAPAQTSQPSVAATRAAPAKSMRTHKRHHKRKAAKVTQQAMSEAQALQRFESELSRSVGKQTQNSDYPEEAIRSKWSGTTLVRAEVSSSGVLEAAAVERTSGFDVLDEQAVKMVMRAVVPPVPERLRGQPVTVNVPIGFYLTN